MIIILGCSGSLGGNLTKVYFNEPALLISRSKTKKLSSKHIKLQMNLNNINKEKILKTIKKKKISGVYFAHSITKKKDNFNISKKDMLNIVNTNYFSNIKFVQFLFNNKILKKNSFLCFFSSTTTFMPRDKQILYCASKTSLDIFCESLSYNKYVVKNNIKIFNFKLGYMKSKNNKLKTFIPKICPQKFSFFLKNFIQKNNSGKYTYPKYWMIIQLMINLTPLFLKRKLIKFF